MDTAASGSPRAAPPSASPGRLFMQGFQPRLGVTLDAHRSLFDGPVPNEGPLRSSMPTSSYSPRHVGGTPSTSSSIPRQPAGVGAWSAWNNPSIARPALASANHERTTSRESSHFDATAGRALPSTSSSSARPTTSQSAYQTTVGYSDEDEDDGGAYSSASEGEIRRRTRRARLYNDRMETHLGMSDSDDDMPLFGTNRRRRPMSAVEMSAADLIYGDGRHIAATIEEFTKQTNAGTGHEGDVDIGKAREALGLTHPESFIQGTNIVPYPYQCIGINWCLHREKEKNGGIVADEMGLGKTCTMISLMALSPPKDRKRKTTLVLCPMALLTQWKDEIEEKTDEGTYDILIYHRESKKGLKKKDISKYDVVITTYGTMAAEWFDEDKDDKRKVEGPLFEVNFHRIILDEAQLIRNPFTRASKAVAELQGKYRWCLTGTPLCNTLTDAFPYLRFIRDTAFCHWSAFRPEITKLEKKQPALAAQRLSIALRPVMLRRCKGSKLFGKPILELTPRTQDDIEVVLDEDERIMYDAIEQQQQAKFNRFLKAGTVLRNYATILTMLLYLRMACDHPCLPTEGGELSYWEDPEEQKRKLLLDLGRARNVMGDEWVRALEKDCLERAVKAIQAEKAGNTEADPDSLCPICRDPIREGKITPCSHRYCGECMENVFSTPVGDGIFLNEADHQDEHSRPCPYCRQTIQKSKLFPLACFEPSDATLERVVKAAEVQAEKEKAAAAAVKIEISDDSDVEDLKPKQEVKVEKSASALTSRKNYISLTDDDDDDDLPDLPIKKEVKKEADVKREKFDIKPKIEIKPKVDSKIDVKGKGKSKATSKRDSGSDDDLPSFGRISKTPAKKPSKKRKSDEGVSEKQHKAKKSKKAKGKSRQLDSDDSYDSMDDFIVDDDDDPENPRKSRSSAKKRRARRESTSASGSEVLSDGTESEEDSKGRKKVVVKTLARFVPSSKMKKMMTEIKALAEVDSTKRDKIIVFSQFTSMLDLVANYLNDNDISHVAYDGRMSLGEKDDAIKTFKKGRIKIMLMSLRAGGVGLNLTCANHVFHLDLAYNTAVESQGFDRVHRIGQKKPCFIHRMVVKNSVEERILALQQRKSALIDAAIGDEAAQHNGRLTVNDLRMLFGLGGAARATNNARIPEVQSLATLPNRVAERRRELAAAGLRMNADGQILDRNGNAPTPVFNVGAGARQPQPGNGGLPGGPNAGLDGFNGLNNLM